MIARFRLILPFKFCLREGDVYSIAGFQRDGYEVHVFPPYQGDPRLYAASSDVSHHFWEEVQNLEPTSQPIWQSLLSIDGKPAITANILQIDLRKQNFERNSKEDRSEWTDPPVDFLFDLANEVLSRLRMVSQAPRIQLINRNEVCFRIEYLDDEGKRLPDDSTHTRGMVDFKTRIDRIPLPASMWQAMLDLPIGMEAHTWDSLLLNAKMLLPDSGAAITVANAAMETFIEWALDELSARSSLSQELWVWMNNRGNFFQNPSTDDQYDILLKVFTGKSLKDYPQLWQTYRRLRKARHSFVHAGTATVDNQVLDVNKASELLAGATEIVRQVEQLLPEELRRPPLVTSSLSTDVNS